MHPDSFFVYFPVVDRSNFLNVCLLFAKCSVLLLLKVSIVFVVVASIILSKEPCTMDVKQLEDIVVLAYLLDDDAVFVSLCAAGMYYSSAIINDLSTERGSCSHRQKQRKTWNEYAEPIDDGSFRRMFRMTKSSFQKLCNIIENAVGEKKFKSQEYLNTHRIARTDKAIDYHGGRICGELKVAVTIRMLAGGSYLDLFSGHDVCYKSVYNMFHEVIAWINQSFSFILPQLLANKNENELNNISEAFARFSSGIFKCII